MKIAKNEPIFSRPIFFRCSYAATVPVGSTSTERARLAKKLVVTNLKNKLKTVACVPS